MKIEELFHIIKTHYLIFCKAENFSHHRSLDVRTIIEKTIDYEYDLNNIGRKINAENRRIKKFNSGLTSNEENLRKDTFSKRFRGKISFMTEEEIIPKEFKDFLIFVYSETSSKGVHGGIGKIDIEDLGTYFFQLNLFVKWFYKKNSKKCDFIKTINQFLYFDPTNLTGLSEKEIKKRKENEKIFKEKYAELERELLLIEAERKENKITLLDAQKKVIVAETTATVTQEVLTFERDQKADIVQKSAQTINQLKTEKENQSKDFINWIARNKTRTVIILIVSVFIITGLFYKINTAPFQMNVGLSIDKTIQVHSDYPQLSKEARVLFYFPDEVKEKEVTFSNEMLLSEIPNKLNDTKCRVELKDPYWTLSKKNLLIQDNAVTLSIKPNKVLSKIKGEVNDIFGNSLNNVFIKMETLSTKTDERGYFSINIPVKERRIQYNIRIKKDGYISKKLEYTAGTSIEIRLNKNH